MFTIHSVSRPPLEADGAAPSKADRVAAVKMATLPLLHAAPTNCLQADRAAGALHQSFIYLLNGATNWGDGNWTALPVLRSFLCAPTTACRLMLIATEAMLCPSASSNSRMVSYATGTGWRL